MGGNVFENSKPISINDIFDCIDEFEYAVLEKVGISKYSLLGTSGIKEISNDVDLGVEFCFSGNDAAGRKRDKLELFHRCKFLLGSEKVSTTGSTVHVLFERYNGHKVQFDLVPCQSCERLSWIQRGLYRNLLMSLLAKKQSERLSLIANKEIKITVAAPGGLQKRVNDDIIIERTDDPDIIASELGFKEQPHFLQTFEDMVSRIKLQGGELKQWLSDFADYTQQFSARDDYKAALDIINS